MTNLETYRSKFYEALKINSILCGTVLDVGCGEGHDAYFFSKRTDCVCALDLKPSAVWKRLKRENLTFIVGDANLLPFRDESFDYIFTKDILHHISNPKRVLREMLRVSKCGRGQVAVIESNRYNPISYIHMTMMRKHNHFSRRQFIELLRSVSDESVVFSLENHVYPISNRLMLRIARLFEVVLENMPLTKIFLSYNLVVMTAPRAKLSCKIIDL